METAKLSLLKKIHWINTSYLIITPLVALIFAPLYLWQHGFGWAGFSLFLAFMVLTSLAVTAGYHRYFAHRSYDAHPVLRFIYVLFGSAAFQGSVLKWSTDHRRHHRFVDTDEDPYNIKRGFFYAHIGWVMLKDSDKYAGKFAPDLERDALLRWQEKYYFPIAVVTGLVFPGLVGWAIGAGWGGLIFGGFVRMVFTNHCTFCINSLAHTWGSRPYDDQQTARDSILMAMIGYGEGYHNYHHVFAADYRNGIRWYHWDPTKWAILLMSLAGWTYRLKAAPATAVLRARLQIDQKRLVQSGVSADRVAALKAKVEEAQRQWKSLCDDYQRRKAELRRQSREKFLEVKAELRVARLEFKMALAQWGAFRKTLRALPVAHPAYVNNFRK